MIRALALSLMGVLLVSGCAGHRSPSASGVSDVEPETQSVVLTGVLEAKPGYTGNKFGVEVENVSVTGGGEVQALELSLPFAAEEVDRIEVESAEGEAVVLPREVEIEPGPDPKNTGIRIFLPKRKNWEFRIRIIDLPEDG